MSKTISAQQIYTTLKPFALTMEQQKAVEDAPTDSPSLVVAGAGSGKTELMAVRVLWLVANGFATPDQILGLTFTRKAASELSKRIYKSLLVLRETELWPAELPYEFSQPTVTTYNAYANGLFRENALALGLEQESSLLTDAAAFQLARDVVIRYGAAVDPRLADLDLKLDSIVERVLDLAGEMNDNLVTDLDIGEVMAKLMSSIANLPKKAGTSDFTQFGYYPPLLAPFANTEILAGLAQAYRTEKYRLGYVDYSDQVALAERAVRELPQVAVTQRDRYRQVLLDEYQDTSFLQTRLLSGLFAGGSVFAVGDPNQSIYGWRGASASNLANFATDFASPDKQTDEHRFELSTSWRNPSHVLELANHLSRDLATPASYVAAGQPHLVPLTLRSRSDAPEGSVLVKVDQTIEEEATSVAEWLSHHREPATGLLPTAAVLMRTKKMMQLFREAIEAKGIGVEVVGLGGLLELSEIVDLTCALRVIHNPASGTDLVRLLTGARWRIGAKDIDRLFRFAKRQNRFHLKDDSVAPEDAVSIVDALDLLLEPDKIADARISEIGLARMQNAARVFAGLRKQVGLPLVEFVQLVQRELWLDVEVMANPNRVNPMQHLTAFSNIVASYAQNNHRPHLGAFLRWLDFAEQRERLEAPATAPQPGVVQLMTIHGSKGLEWDLVAVANLAEGDFPSTTGGATGWLSTGTLPYPLRGDQGSLPTWQYSQVASQPDLKKSIAEFKEQVKLHQYREELRLIYVAVTRPKTALLLTGSYWKPGVKKPKNPSVFLQIAAELPDTKVTVVNRNPESVFPKLASDENPLSVSIQTQTWPLEPLGEAHGLKVHAAAKLVKDALTKKLEAAEIDNIELLLREREARAKASIEISLPVRINASGFKDYLTKPNETAQKMLRPMPQQPYKATRAGTIFHGLMEQRNAALIRALSDAGVNGDGLNIELESEDIWVRQLEQDDLAQHQATVEELQANFALSRWASRVAIEAETEIQLGLGNNIFICKLDAVFQNEDGNIEIVDWKTGKAPTDEVEKAERSLQLGLYRIAYSILRGVPLAKISTCLYYVSENLEVVPTNLITLEELRERWSKIV